MKKKEKKMKVKEKEKKMKKKKRARSSQPRGHHPTRMTSQPRPYTSFFRVLRAVAVSRVCSLIRGCRVALP